MDKYRVSNSYIWTYIECQIDIYEQIQNVKMLYIVLQLKNEISKQKREMDKCRVSTYYMFFFTDNTQTLYTINLLFRSEISLFRCSRTESTLTLYLSNSLFHSKILLFRPHFKGISLESVEQYPIEIALFERKPLVLSTEIFYSREVATGYCSFQWDIAFD